MAGEPPPGAECRADLTPLQVHLAAVRELVGSRKFLFCAGSHVGSLIPDAGQRLTMRVIQELIQSRCCLDGEGDEMGEMAPQHGKSLCP